MKELQLYQEAREEAPRYFIRFNTDPAQIEDDEVMQAELVDATGKRAPRGYLFTVQKDGTVNFQCSVNREAAAAAGIPLSSDGSMVRA